MTREPEMGAYIQCSQLSPNALSEVLLLAMDPFINVFYLLGIRNYLSHPGGNEW
jgi:hypothetical protein